MLARFVRDYELVEPYSASRNSDVYLARKRESDGLFLLKFLKNSNGAASGGLNTVVSQKKRFKKEIDFVSSFEHRNISRLIDSSLDEESGFLVYPYNKGNLLSTILELGTPLGLGDSINLILQLLAAQEYIHARGIVHGNIHPDNIFITSDKKLELFDFGYSMTEDEAAGLPEGRLLGTPPYIAPEQLGFTEFKLDSRTDLYCTCLILYQMIAGRLPITATQDSLEQYLNIILKTEVPPIKNAPLIFNKIILKALNATPSERYQTAPGLIWDIKFAQKNHEDKAAYLLVGQKDSVIAVNRRKFFVGRLQELSLLEKGLTRFSDGKPYTQIIYGQSGIGKTDLVLQFRKQINSDRFNLLSTKCNKFTANQPFSVLRDLVLEEISKILESPKEERDCFISKINSELVEQSGVICDIIPEMRALFREIRSVEEIEKEKEADRLIYLLFTLLNTLSNLKPLILFVDDFQWIDNTSYLVFKKALEEKIRCFFIWNYRSEEGKEDLYVTREDLRRLPVDAVTRVKAFTRDDIEELMFTKLGGVSNLDRLVDTLLERTDGSPFTITEAVRFLVNEGILRMGENGWEYREHNAAVLPRQFDALALIMNKMAAINVREKRYLQLASLVQGNFHKEIIEELGEFDSNSSNAIVDALENQGFILNQLKGGYCFIHDKLQESITSSLDKEESLRLNEKLGEIYQRKAEKNKEHLIVAAEHYLKSKNLAKAVALCEQAADHSKESLALEQAVHYYKLITLMTGKSKHVDGISPIKINHINKKLGDVLIQTGKNTEALRTFRKLLDDEHFSDKNEILQCKYKIGTIYRNMGNIEGGIQFIEEALSELNVTIPKTKISILFSLGYQFAIQLFFPIGIKRILKKNQERNKLKVRILNNLSYLYFFKDMTICLWAHYKSLNIADLFEDCYEKVETYAHHMVGAYQLMLKKRAFRYFRKSLKISDKIKRADADAFIQYVGGLINFWDTKWKDALFNLNHNIKNLKKIGDSWGQVIPIETIIYTYFHMGNFEEAKHYIDQNLQLTQKCNDVRGMVQSKWMRNKYKYLHGESNLNDWNALEKKVDLLNDNMTKTLIKIDYAKKYLIENNIKSASKVITEAIDLIKKHKLIQEYTAGAFGCFCEILIAEKIQRSYKKTDLNISDEDLIKLLKKNTTASFIRSVMFPAYWGLFFRCLAWGQHFRGRSRLANLFFKKAIKKHHSHGMSYEEAKSRVSYAAFLEECFLPGDAADQLNQAKLLFEKCGSKLDVKLLENKFKIGKEQSDNLYKENSLESINQKIDKFDSNRIRIDALLEVSRSISEVQDLDVLLTQILRAIVKATGAKMGSIFINREEFSLQTDKFVNYKGEHVPMGEFNIAKEVVNWVKKEKRSLLIHDCRTDERVLIENKEKFKSVFCFPILKEERCFGIVYLSNDNVTNLFTKDAENAANIISTQAGILLENARLLQNYQTLNTKLQATVKQQTKDITVKNKQLGEYNLKLVETERMKNILTGTIVHDIKNYVTGIEGNLKVMKIRFGKEAKNLRSINAASDACQDVVSLSLNMLDIGRMEDGSLPIKLKEISYYHIYEMMLKMSNLQAFIQNEIKIEISKPSKEFIIHADLNLLERVLQNLFNNAAKYTPQNGIVKVNAFYNSNQRVISVFNSGSPIKSEYKKSIFEKYNRAGSDWSPYSKGLGLFFCKMVMNAHDGDIWLETDETGNFFNLGFKGK